MGLDGQPSGQSIFSCNYLALACGSSVHHVCVECAVLCSQGLCGEDMDDATWCTVPQTDHSTLAHAYCFLHEPR